MISLCLTSGHWCNILVNCKNAPAYELAKYLTRILQNNLHLPYAFNIRNSIHLITDLQNIEIQENTRLCSFDIENMYTNVPKLDTIEMMMIMEQLVEWGLAGETEVLGENLPQCHFVDHKSHMT
jgi:hypothetical protein